MKKMFFLCFIAAFVYACGGSNDQTSDNNATTEENPYEAAHEQIDHATEHMSNLSAPGQLIRVLFICQTLLIQ